MRTFAACSLSDISISCFSPFSLVHQTDKQVFINGHLSLFLVPLSWVNDKSILLNNPFLQPHVKPYSKAQNHSYTCYNPKCSWLCGFSFFPTTISIFVGIDLLVDCPLFLVALWTSQWFLWEKQIYIKGSCWTGRRVVD